MTDTSEFSGRSALITGGTRWHRQGHRGPAARRGRTVLVAARSVPDGAPGGVIAADVSTADGVEALGAEALHRLGPRPGIAPCAAAVGSVPANDSIHCAEGSLAISALTVSALGPSA